MTLKLTTKEKMLLEDQQKHEELCVQKYQSYAQQAQDPQLQQLFTSLAQKEKEHLNSIIQILNGQLPQIQQNQAPTTQFTPPSVPNQQRTLAQENDHLLCSDMLATEKYISGTYDTTIFECTNRNLRQVLNHIQKEEQEHGEQIFNYMQSHGFYNPQ